MTEKDENTSSSYGLKESAGQVRATWEELMDNMRKSRIEGRKAVSAFRPQPVKRMLQVGGPLRKIVESRPMILLGEPLIKRLRKA